MRAFKTYFVSFPPAITAKAFGKLHLHHQQAHLLLAEQN